MFVIGQYQILIIPQASNKSEIPKMTSIDKEIDWNYREIARGWFFWEILKSPSLENPQKETLN